MGDRRKKRVSTNWVRACRPGLIAEVRGDKGTYDTGVALGIPQSCTTRGGPLNHLVNTSPVARGWLRRIWRILELVGSRVHLQAFGDGPTEQGDAGGSADGFMSEKFVHPRCPLGCTADALTSGWMSHLAQALAAAQYHQHSWVPRCHVPETPAADRPSFCADYLTSSRAASDRAVLTSSVHDGVQAIAEVPHARSAEENSQLHLVVRAMQASA